MEVGNYQVAKKLDSRKPESNIYVLARTLDLRDRVGLI